jgi:hypothetical protein
MDEQDGATVVAKDATWKAFRTDLKRNNTVADAGWSLLAPASNLQEPRESQNNIDIAMEEATRDIEEGDYSFMSMFTTPYHRGRPPGTTQARSKSKGNQLENHCDSPMYNFVNSTKDESRCLSPRSNSKSISKSSYAQSSMTPGSSKSSQSAWSLFSLTASLQLSLADEVVSSAGDDERDHADSSPHSPSHERIDATDVVASDVPSWAIVRQRCHATKFVKGRLKREIDQEENHKFLLQQHADQEENSESKKLPEQRSIKHEHSTVFQQQGHIDDAFEEHEEEGSYGRALDDRSIYLLLTVSKSLGVIQRNRRRRLKKVEQQRRTAELRLLSPRHSSQHGVMETAYEARQKLSLLHSEPAAR